MFRACVHYFIVGGEKIRDFGFNVVETLVLLLHYISLLGFDFTGEAVEGGRELCTHGLLLIAWRSHSAVSQTDLHGGKAGQRICLSCWCHLGCCSLEGRSL